MIKPVILGVSELLYQVRRVCQEHVGWVAVKGELSGCQEARSGHLYCRLKDRQGAIDVVMFRPAREMLRFVPEDGMEVICWGESSVFAPQGRLQLSVELMERVGWGTAAYALKQRKERLAEEGLFASARKRALPRYPRKIALVTSATGAALQDLLHVLRRRSPSCDLVLASCQVQGEGAAEQMAATIERVNHWDRRVGARIDLIILGRGGGSAEDLWPFQEEVLVRAIASSALPVLTGIGHETDVSLADWAADARAPTPSAAAEIAVPDEAQLLGYLRVLKGRLCRAILRFQEQQALQFRILVQRLHAPKGLLVQRRQGLSVLQRRLVESQTVRLQRARLRLQQLEERLLANDSRQILLRLRSSVGRYSQAMQLSIRAQYRRDRQRLEMLAACLHGLSPLAVLQRGYALAYAEDGRVISDAHQVVCGDGVRLRLHNGWIMARVEQRQELLAVELPADEQEG